MKVKLDGLNAEIDSLTTKASGVSTDIRKEVSEQIALLRMKRAAAGQKVKELQHAGEGAREDVKSGIELA